MSSGADWISNGLAWWVQRVLRLRKLTIVACLLASVVSLHYAANNLGINTDTADMISPTLPWRQAFIEYRETFVARNRNLVVVIDAPAPEQADALAAALARELRSLPALYESVFLPGDGEFFERNGLLYLPLDELEVLTNRLAEAQPLLGRLTRRFDGAGLIHTVGEVVGNADSAGAEAPQQLYAELGRTLEAARRGERRPVSWQRLIAAEEAEDARRFLLVQPVQDFTKVQPAAAAIEDIRERAARLEAELPARASVQLTGTVAMEHEELVSVSRGAGLAGLAALLMVAAVLYWALRSTGLVVISVLTLLVGLAGTAAFAAATVGHLNLLSVAFAVLYIGLGVDFAIHVCLRLKELLAAGLAIEPALVETARGVGHSLVICSVTTAAGFYAFIPTPFQGVSELGLISGTGMFISLLATITLLPALAAQFLRHPGADAPTAWVGARVATPLINRPGAVVAVAGVVAVASFAALPAVTFDSNPVNLRDPNAESVRALEELADRGQAEQLQLVAVAPDAVTARSWAAKLEKLPLVREVRTVDSLVPADQEEKLWLLSDLELLMGPGFAELQRRPPDPSSFEAALSTLGHTLNGGSRRGEQEAALGAAVDGLLARLDELDEHARRALLLELEQDLLANLPAQLRRIDNSLSAQPFGADALPGDLVARWFGPRDVELLEILPAENIIDEDAASRFVAAVQGVVPRATGLPVVYQEASNTVIRSFQLAFLYAFIMVVAILLIFLRNVRDALLVAVPIVVAGGVTAGLTVPLGIPFNFANIIALPLLMGIGVDSSIHIVHRMRSEPPPNGEFFSTSTSRAVFASGLTTVATFGNLGFAAHQGMASMGQLLALGMAVTLATTLILLPALLKLTGGARAA